MRANVNPCEAEAQATRPKPRAAAAPTADHLYQALLNLVDEARKLDAKILEDLQSMILEDLSSAMEVKQRLTSALFAIAPRCLDANPHRREEILSLLSAFQQSHLRVEAALVVALRSVNRELGRACDHAYALSHYAQRRSSLA
jgi:hypothetical protein